MKSPKHFKYHIKNLSNAELFKLIESIQENIDMFSSNDLKEYDYYSILIQEEVNRRAIEGFHD